MAVGPFVRVSGGGVRPERTGTGGHRRRLPGGHGGDDRSARRTGARGELRPSAVQPTTAAQPATAAPVVPDLPTERPVPDSVCDEGPAVKRSSRHWRGRPPDRSRRLLRTADRVEATASSRRTPSRSTVMSATTRRAALMPFALLQGVDAGGTVSSTRGNSGPREAPADADGGGLRRFRVRLRRRRWRCPRCRWRRCGDRPPARAGDRRRQGGPGNLRAQALHVRVDGNHMLWTTTLLFDPAANRSTMPSISASGRARASPGRASSTERPRPARSIRSTTSPYSGSSACRRASKLRSHARSSVSVPEGDITEARRRASRAPPVAAVPR